MTVDNWSLIHLNSYCLKLQLNLIRACNKFKLNAIEWLHRLARKFSRKSTETFATFQLRSRQNVRLERSSLLALVCGIRLPRRACNTLQPPFPTSNLKHVIYNVAAGCRFPLQLLRGCTRKPEAKSKSMLLCCCCYWYFCLYFVAFYVHS